MMRKRLFVSVLVGSLYAVLPARPAQAQYRPDSWVTMKAKLALLVAQGVDGTDINVDTIDGRVTLHGKVDSEEEKAAAEKRVRDVEGVRDVQVLLQVVPPSEEERIEESDEDVTERIEQLVGEDRWMTDSGVEVASVNDGVVLLRGEMDSLSRHLYVVDKIRQVPGVREVNTEVEVPDEVADRELQRAEEEVTVRAEAERASPSESDEAEDDRNLFEDTWLTTAVKTKLMAEPDVPALDINVDTRNGIVTLFGVVSSAEAKAAAERTALDLDGVKAVTNELRVAPESQAEAVEARDDEIEEQIEQALESREQLADADIEVEVEGGVVRLTGSVDSVSQRMAALTAARSVRGVRAVRSELTVEPRRSSSG